MYLYGFLFSVLITKVFFGKIKSGKKPNIIINIPPFIVESKILIFNKHIHHWVIFSFILIGLFIFKKKQQKYNNLVKFIVGFSIFMIIHGLQYDDAFDFTNKPYSSSK